tara:strand:- start:274 stop:423 length:150 start_codon:yes stop_codon:yes gene_type:complete
VRVAEAQPLLALVGLAVVALVGQPQLLGQRTQVQGAAAVLQHRVLVVQE